MRSLHPTSLLCSLPKLRQGITCAAVLGLLTAPLAAQPCDSLERRTTRQSVNLGSGWSVPIVANPGHLPEDVAFTALGATDTAYRFHHSGAVEVLLPNDASVTLHTLLGDAEAQATDLQAESPQTAPQRWQTSEGNFEMLAFGALSVHTELGLTARHHVNSRLLRTTYDGPWLDLGLRVSGLLNVGPEGADGSLPLHLEGGGVRLYAATYGEGEAQRRIPFHLDSNDVLRLDPQAMDGVTDDLPLQVVWETTPYFHGYDAIAGPNGNAMAVTTTRGAIQGEGRDLLILGLDAGGVPTFSTVLASRGDDRAAAITASSSERLYVAGYQGQSGLAVDGQSRKAAGPFLLQLSRDGRSLAGRYLEGDDIAAVHDIAMDGEDRLVISGQATRKVTQDGEALPMELSVPTDGALLGEVLVVELDEELQPTGRRSHVTEVALDTRLEVRPACHGLLYVGPSLVTSAQASCTGNLVTDTYQAANPNPSNFFDGAVNAGSPADPWGWHALRWKRETQLGHAYTPPTVAPFQTVRDTDDHTDLDDLERDVNVFATEPSGSWLLNTSMSAEETAIGAALYMDFWTSPSYANLKLSTEVDPHPVALMEVEFCVDAIGSNNSVTDYCAASAASVGIFSPRYPIDTIDFLCNSQYGFGMINIRHVDIDHWVGGTSFTQGTRLIQPVFRSAVDDAGTLKGWYIADPPDGAVADGLVSEAARRMSGHAVRAVPTRTYRVLEDGSVKPMGDGEGWIPALPEMASAP